MSNAGNRSGESPDSFNKKCFLTKKPVKTAAFLVNYTEILSFFNNPLKTWRLLASQKKTWYLVAGPVTA